MDVASVAEPHAGRQLLSLLTNSDSNW